jgi:hypothetical protein
LTHTADQAANAAVVVVAVGVDLATVGRLVVVTVGKPGGAVTVTNAPTARWYRNMVGRAYDATTAAIAGAALRIHFAAVYALVAVAVGKAGVARTVTVAEAARR